MSAGQLPIYIEQGSTFEMVLTLTDEASALIDLSGETFRGQVRKTTSDAAIQAAFQFEKLTLGSIRCFIPASVTTLIEMPKATGAVKKTVAMVYDIESEGALGVVRRWVEGVATVSPEASK